MPSPNLPAGHCQRTRGHIHLRRRSLTRCKQGGRQPRVSAYDDAFITFRYARQFAETRMLVYTARVGVEHDSTAVCSHSVDVGGMASFARTPVVCFNIVVDAGILVLSTRLARDARVKDPHTWLLIFLSFSVSIRPGGSAPRWNEPLSAGEPFVILLSSSAALFRLLASGGRVFSDLRLC